MRMKSYSNKGSSRGGSLEALELSVKMDIFTQLVSNDNPKAHRNEREEGLPILQQVVGSGL